MKEGMHRRYYTAGGGWDYEERMHERKRNGMRASKGATIKYGRKARRTEKRIDYEETDE